MAVTTLANKAVGSKIKIKVDGSYENFIVVHQGRPSSMYDSSCTGGTIVLMEDLYVDSVWNDDETNSYSGSTVDLYLGNEFVNLIESNIKSKIKQVKVPYRAGSGTSTAVSSGSNGLLCKVFLLSGYEVGLGSGSSYAIPTDGATLSYFSGIETEDTNSKRIAYFNGFEASWWLRSPRTDSSNKAWAAMDSGSIRSADVDISNDGRRDYGARPAFVLPDTLLVADDGTVTTNTAPTVPSSITVPDTVNGGTAIDISWGTSTDADSNLSGYKLEKSVEGGAWTQIYQGTLTKTTDTVSFGTGTVAYRVKAYDSIGAESAYQTSPTKTVINNRAPSAPGSIIVPAVVLGGSELTVSWAASTDSDNNLAGYTLESKEDDGAFTELYKGPNLFYTDTVTKGLNTVTYRVKAYDTDGAESAYTTSPARTVDNTSPPVITSDISGDLGVKSGGFSWEYTVTQPDGQDTTVTETVDGDELRSYTADLGQANTFDLSPDYFMELLNGPHTMQVNAVTGAKPAAYSVTFTKEVYGLSITLSEPIPAGAAITKAVITVTRNIPADANFQVLVTNNANDDSPVWEDATDAVINGNTYVFTNTALENEPALNFKVTASRGPSNVGGFINSIGGAFV